MKFRRRIFALLMSVMLLMPTLPLGVVAADPPDGMINIPEESDWQGSVFGDVGGNDRITPENFEITEHPDGTVSMKSADDRGKIASNAEGIAYYYQEIPEGVDFEISAKAKVEAWTSGNNQVSFGIMVRSKVAENINFRPNDEEDPVYSPYYFGNYVALGALDQKMKGFYRGSVTTISKIDFSASISDPLEGEQYDLKLRKMGSLYELTINGESVTVTDYDGSENKYVGLFTARNTTITYSDIELNMESADEVDLGDWEFRAFGSNTSEGRNPDPAIHEDGSVTLKATGGKIAAGDEGISFYYKEVPANANFEIHGTAFVHGFNLDSGISTPNQKSFGIMLRDQVVNHRDSSTVTSNYVLVGALDTVMKAVYKQDAGISEINDGKGTQVKLDPFPGIDDPSSGETYDLKIQKSGSTYIMTVNGQSEIISVDDLFTDPIYAGLYVARDAEITFSNFDIVIEQKSVTALNIDASAMKRNYLVNEQLDLIGLKVTAIYSDDSMEELEPGDYIVTGFDSSVAGANIITIHYGGQTATIELTIEPLEMTSLAIIYYPAKTDYYLQDAFDPTGLVVEGNYLDGYLVTILDEELYTLAIDGQVISEEVPYMFTSAGEHLVTVTSVETPSIRTSFNVNVSDAVLEKLEIRQQPEITQYFLGDVLDLDGMIIHALYSDGSDIRLLRDEYTVTGFDSDTIGDKTLVINHKGITTELVVHVKERELTGIEVTFYPQTTFQLNEEFHHLGLFVSKVYDNGDRVGLSEAEYVIDASGFDSTQEGVYSIQIIPTDSSIEPITYQVTVRASQEYEWNFIRFGQSTSDNTNTIKYHDDGSIELAATGGSAGKITGDHDGISFYYTVIDAVEDNFVLSADIQVIDYAKNPHDGQESFGIMARDAMDEPSTANVFASNIAAIGGYSGSTRNPNGTQLFVRTGVESSDGAGSQGIQAIMLQNEKPGPSNTHPEKPYRLTLAKTNSGFVGWINHESPEIIFEPDILNVQDSKAYVGFYVARQATIRVSNIEFGVSAAATDAPRIEPPPQPVTPELDIVSLDKTPETDYQLLLKSNVNGWATVKQGHDEIARYIDVEQGKTTAIPTTLDQGDNRFSVTFIPDDTQLLDSYDNIIQNFTVHVKSYEGDIYVSPTGSPEGLGTVEDPTDLDSAISYVKAGQTIYMLDGIYVRNAPLDIKKYNDGKPDARKTLKAAPGATPVVDFDRKSEGVLLSGDYWHVKGIGFARSAPNTKGFTIGGNHNIVENSHFFENGDTGLQISRTDFDANHIDDWPSYNLILNSASYFNRDPSNNNADGFAAKLTSGVGNVFRGNIAFNNIDDGWDLYAKAGSGPIGAVIIEDSIAFNNGFVPGVDGTGDGNGFKLGGEGIHVEHVIRNSIAFNNLSYGFTSNSNPGLILEATNIGFNNEGGNLNLSSYAGIPLDFKLDGFISYHTNEGARRDNYPSNLESDTNFLFDGTVSKNKSGLTLSDDNFVSLTPPDHFERDEEGNIIWGDFLKFIAPSGSGSPPIVWIPTQPEEGVQVHLQLHNGVASGTINGRSLQDAFDRAEANAQGVKRVVVEVPELEGATTYALTIPAQVVSTAGELQELMISTSFAEIVLPGHMLANLDIADAETVTLLIENIDRSTLPAEVVAQVGDRPVIAFSLRVGDEEIVFNNPNAPVWVGIPYEPTAEELSNSEHITVWYIDDAGQVTPITSGRYDHESGRVTFRTTHFSPYAIVFVQKTFNDIGQIEWAKRQIEVLASKGVIRGTSDTTFAPQSHITRADFTLLLVRTFGLGVAEIGPSFDDVTPADYYYEELSIAKQLGIAQGRGDGNFYPNERVTRQDMFVIAARALKAKQMLDQERADLGDYRDHADIAAYATDDLAALVHKGLVQGSNQQLRPTDLATRAEAGVFIYSIYSLLD